MRVLAPICRVGGTISDTLFAGAASEAALLFAKEIPVPAHLLEILFLVEDKRFAFHSGIDLIAILRAVAARALKQTCVQGASTLTQQLFDIRREKMGVKRSRTLRRKLHQAGWAICKDLISSKQAILLEYVNSAYVGKNYYGFPSGGRGYFQKSLRDLSIAESLFLVDRLALPNQCRAGRVGALLNRAPIAHLLSSVPGSVTEVLDVYQRLFACGDEICRNLGKPIKKLAKPTPTYSWARWKPT